MLAPCSTPITTLNLTVFSKKSLGLPGRIAKGNQSCAKSSLESCSVQVPWGASGKVAHFPSFAVGPCILQALEGCLYRRTGEAGQLGLPSHCFCFLFVRHVIGQWGFEGRESGAGDIWTVHVDKTKFL